MDSREVIEAADIYQNKQDFLMELIESDYFSITQINNPKKPEHKTSIIRLNHNNTIIRQWYPELSKVTDELTHIFEEKGQVLYLLKYDACWTHFL